MGLLRKKTIFHAEESVPDPEVLKLRFRRRVLTATLFGFLVVLGAPVARDLRHDIHGRAQARLFTQQLLSGRLSAAVSRAPVSFTISPDNLIWKRSLHAAGENCGVALPGSTSDLGSDGTVWKIQAQQENGTPIAGHTLCWHPTRGLLLDSTPLGEGKLLITVSVPNEAESSGIAFVLISRGGAEVQTIGI